MAKDRVLSGAGYWMIPAPQNYHGKIYSTGLIYEHRYVLERKLGRYLRFYESAHHLNENKLDNRPENLELVLTKVHRIYHAKQRGTKIVVFKCPSCDTIFEKQKRSVYKRKFVACSPFCRGKINRKIKHEGLSEELKKNLMKILFENIKDTRKRYLKLLKKM